MRRAFPVPHLVEGCDVVASGTNDLVIKNANTTSVVLGLSLDDLRTILAAVDGEKDLEAIIADLAEEYDPDDLRRVLEELNGSVISFGPTLVGGPGPERALAGARVLVVARGLLGQTIHALLSEEGARCEVWPDAPFASCVDERFRSASRTRSLANEPPAPSSAAATPWTVDALVQWFRGCAVVVCALEDVFYRAILDVNRAAFLAGVAVVYATADGTGRAAVDLDVPGPQRATAYVQAFALEIGGDWFASRGAQIRFED